MKKEKNEDVNSKKLITGFFIKLAVFIVALVVMFGFVFGLMQMKGEVMYPKLRDGDLMLYYRLDRSYRLSDVIVYNNNGYKNVGRIVAKGGDLVEITTEGQLKVNGNVQDEEIFYPTMPLDSSITYPYQVEEGHVFVLCDFRTNALDSRYYGQVSEKDIKGKIVAVFRRRGI